MSKILRKTAQIFGLTAGSSQIAQFGSKAEGTPTFTNDPSVIQSLSAWAVGWFDAVVATNSPCIEDMNAFCFVMAYQIAYMLQAGVGEYDSGTTYYTGSLVNNGSGTSYASIADSNTGNALTNPTYWAQPIQNGSVTPNTLPSSTTIATGNTLMWPNLVVPTGDTLTIATGSNYIGFVNLTLQGTAVLILQGTAVAKII